MTVVNDYTVAQKIRHLHHIIGIRQASSGLQGGVAVECTILGNPHFQVRTASLCYHRKSTNRNLDYPGVAQLPKMVLLYTEHVTRSKRLFMRHCEGCQTFAPSFWHGIYGH